MEEQQFPKDENLRLILSTDQEQWLNQRIRDWRRFAWGMAIVLVVSSAWVTAAAMGAFSRFDEPECISFIGSTLDEQAQRDQIAASGLQPCPPPVAVQAETGTDWQEVRGMVIYAALVLILLSFLGLLRGLFQLRMYKGYLVDHQAFLEKYNR